ncbi:TonB-dependent receptor [Spirulina sp. CS-785/01]|uniref:TonB-dependent receptor n=1 Tax=Spirulina sp. CS-785/01 TaxID=3021716 RepID=UPI00232B3F54|nr:TonB-dependent receptor [Spirulina sp. CS-785/01]MDB9312294.1 TonB-dependent receptor [Spirulina sp. CS-785/01]
MQQSLISLSLLSSLIVLSPFALWESVLAQENSSEEEPTLRINVTDTILDTPTSTPFRGNAPLRDSTRPTYVIDREQIEQQGARTIRETLRFLPGILGDGTTGTEVNGLSGQFIRGSNSSQVLILLDGRPINALGFGGFDLSEITTDVIERVEVLPGGGSTLYGSDAIGGIINIITRRPSDEFSGQVGVEVGSYGYNEQNLELSDSFGDFGYFLNYNRVAAENEYDYTIEGVTRTRENNDTEYNNLAVRLEQEIGDRALLRFTSFYLPKEQGLPGGVPVADPPFGQGFFNSLTDNNRKFTDQVLNDLSLEVDLGEDGNSVLTARFFLDYLNIRFDNRTEVTETLSFTPPFQLQRTEPDQQRFETEQRSLGFQVQHNWQITPNQNIVYGFDYRNTNVNNLTQNLTTNKIRTNFNDEISQGALFAQYAIDPVPAWTVVLGLRQEFSSLINGSVTSPSIGTKIQASDSTIFRANYIRNFRTPTVANLFNANPTNIGNPDLDPERGNSFDIGIDQAIGNAALLRLTYYNNTISDLIAFKRISPPENGVSGTWQNLGKVRSQGLEASVNVQPAPNVFFSIGYTLNEPEILKSVNPEEEGQELRFAGADKLNLGVWYENQYGWYAGLLMNSLGSYPTNNTNTEFLPGYTTFDARLRAPITPDLTVEAGVRNLFDQRYQLFSGFPDSGRTINLGVEYNF